MYIYVYISSRSPQCGCTCSATSGGSAQSMCVPTSTTVAPCLTMPKVDATVPNCHCFFKVDVHARPCKVKINR